MSDAHPPNPSQGDSGTVTSERHGLWHRLRRAVIGPARDPMDPKLRQHITLVAFLAWVGLGADGLSSSCYGPEEAFKALYPHYDLSLFLAVATFVTVFVIAVGYNQVIELFPSGGGGYKVATRLLGKYAGLVSGGALVVDYVLTIAISIAAGVDAILSFLPGEWNQVGLEIKLLFLLALGVLNLRGVKESITILLPIFLGFVLTHAFLIIYGITLHTDRIGSLIPDTLSQFSHLSGEIGAFPVIALLLRAYSLGGGTYTGIEAVSNGVNQLREPRIQTGKWTMFYMALSLAFTAGGIILLYLLWQARPVEGQTLNAVVFSSIVSHWQWGEWNVGHTFLVLTLMLEAGLLFVAAETGFLGGPMVLANMAVDNWVPHRFTQLSDRLVTKNGILLMGLAALAILLWSRGRVGVLVVLYSINVFLTFSMSLLGMCVYWWRNRDTEPGWFHRLLLSATGCTVTVGILLVTLVEKFDEGGWITALVTSSFIGLCLLVYRHYNKVRAQRSELDEILADLPPSPHRPALPLQADEPTAAFFVYSYRGIGIHTLLNVQRMFPGYFKNFVFLSVGEIDNTSIKGDHAIENLREEVEDQLQKYVEFCHSHHLPAVSYSAYGTDPVELSINLGNQVLERFPNTVFFAGTLVFRNESWITRLLHNYTAYAIQRQLHLKGAQLVIMPMLVD
ncbi:MAG: APC family permease [Gammaproteobacteria bacterium]|nr:APC family permease [Gammaproteobacteria bacterium]